MNVNELLKAYRTLWNNRMLPVEQSEYQTLEAAIKKELLDEMTHPRVRKSTEEKLELSIKRIEESSLPKETKEALCKLHVHIKEKVT
ncbi:hypothetical protein ACNRWW_11945 [Metabacillus sp. HB246100]|uniref:hypothetical protein n=1 Tax=Bacillus weihaiensis TaxID=1547283 RepID=UPI0023530AA2|nr:hypothetical protein [Bacillus weihaiensis]